MGSDTRAGSTPACGSAFFKDADTLWVSFFMLKNMKNGEIQVSGEKFFANKIFHLWIDPAKGTGYNEKNKSFCIVSVKELNRYKTKEERNHE